jgi:hypothetical protein
LGDAAYTVHLVFHTGLGRWTDCQLLLSESDESENANWWTSHYGAGIVKAQTGQVGTYQARGSLGPWLRSRLPRCNYRFATAEFGTYSPARVIQELVRELGWHARLGTQSAEHWSRRRLADTFVPRSRRWRTSALERGFSLIRCAADSLWPSAP